MTKNISVTNELVITLLKNSKNASTLVEEALLYYVYAIQNGLLNDAEINRIYSQGLIRF